MILVRMGIGWDLGLCWDLWDFAGVSRDWVRGLVEWVGVRFGDGVGVGK